MGCYPTKPAQPQTADQYLGNGTERHQDNNERNFPTNMIRKPPSHDAKISLIDLPPEIIEKVFAYLPDAEVYRNVRNTCRRLRDIGMDIYSQVGS